MVAGQATDIIRSPCRPKFSDEYVVVHVWHEELACLPLFQWHALLLPPNRPTRRVHLRIATFTILVTAGWKTTFCLFVLDRETTVFVCVLFFFQTYRRRFEPGMGTYGAARRQSFGRPVYILSVWFNAFRGLVGTGAVRQAGRVVVLDVLQGQVSTTRGRSQRVAWRT